MTDTPKLEEIWLNNRNGHQYQIIGLPKWSDTPNVDNSTDDADQLETWVVMMNVYTGYEFVRSMDSFMGTNRNGQPRFRKVEGEV